MRITIFISALSGGGAERVSCNLANFLLKKGHSVEILTMGEATPAEPLLEGIKEIPLLRDAERGNPKLDFFKRIWRLRKYMKKEEVDERVTHFERFMNGEVVGHKKLIRDYSAGNKQKIGIISALLHQPKVLILDEPFNFLDPSSQSIIKHMLKEYNQQTGATILVSSHNLNHTVDVCPRIALMEQGHIIRDIDNHDGSAEKELEDYFNVNVME